MTSREDKLRELFGDDFDIEQTPETMAFTASMEFSTEIIMEMESQGVSLKALAGKIGIRPSTLCEKLNGKSNLTLKSAAEIALALDCDLQAPRLSKKSRVLASASITLTGARSASDRTKFSPVVFSSQNYTIASISTPKGETDDPATRYSAAA